MTAGSSSLDTFYDEQPADFDKPKDKKKKKKKDKEKSFGSPEEEKGKKKVNIISVGIDILAYNVKYFKRVVCVCVSENLMYVCLFILGN